MHREPTLTQLPLQGSAMLFLPTVLFPLPLPLPFPSPLFFLATDEQFELLPISCHCHPAPHCRLKATSLSDLRLGAPLGLGCRLQAFLATVTLDLLLITLRLDFLF